MRTKWPQTGNSFSVSIRTVRAGEAQLRGGDAVPAAARAKSYKNVLLRSRGARLSHTCPMVVLFSSDPAVARRGCPFMKMIKYRSIETFANPVGFLGV